MLYLPTTLVVQVEQYVRYVCVSGLITFELNDLWPTYLHADSSWPYLGHVRRSQVEFLQSQDELEALGQCIPPPKHVLSVPPSGESVWAAD